MKRHFLPIQILLIAGLCSSCVVGKKKYQQEVATRLTCEEKVRNLEGKASGLENDTTQYGIRYRSLEAAKNFLEQTSTSEKEHLSSELTKRSKDLSQKESLLLEREKKLQELQSLLQRQEDAVKNLRKSVTDALGGYKGDELNVEMKNGKVYVSLQEKLLFKSGSDKVDAKGKEAIQKLAAVLARQPDIDIMIEGHTDNVPLIKGRFEDNWDLSASRALSIVRILTESGLDPKRTIAAGRSEYLPVADNATPEGKARNRRTEIILSPKLDEILRILESK